MSTAALFTPADQAPAYGETRAHPAKFNAAILAELARLIWLEAHRLRRARRDVIVLDPFAGTGSPPTTGAQRSTCTRPTSRMRATTAPTSPRSTRAATRAPTSFSPPRSEARS